MRLAVLIGALLGGCSGDGTGLVVYSEAGTGHIMTVEVATGTTSALDLGVFADVSIAADGQHVAYMGDDSIPKVCDLLGNVTELPPTNGCSTPLVWGPGSTLQYCIVDGATQFAQIGFMPGIGAAVRTLEATSIALSSDGSRIAYLELADPTTGSQGDLVVEDASGANRQVLASDLEVDRIAFLPADSGLVLSDIIADNQFVEHVAAVAFAGGGLVDLGAGVLVEPLPNGSRFSPDGHEVLATTGSELAAIDLASGAQHNFAMAGADVTVVGAAFVAADRIVYARQDSSFMGDVGSNTSSVRFADGTDEVTLVSSDGSSQCQVADVAASAGQVALVCAVPAIVDLDGNLITSRNASAALGISADHDGMVTVDANGLIEYVADDGTVKTLATANTSMTAPSTTLLGPFAAYAP